MKMTTVDYLELRESWPSSGQVVLAQYDDESIVVYQAFNAVTAAYAVEHQQLGGPRYSLDRMSWIKPNFMWMMYRCDWLRADGEQARVLAIRINRTFFDELLRTAVASSFGASGMDDRASWRRAVRRSDVRLQWDPDHGPRGQKLERRAVQLGLRGEVLRRFVFEETLSIEDISEFVAEQREHLAELSRLRVPWERVYPTA
jgi:hypothetical protein